MKQINNHFLKIFYESFTFILPKNQKFNNNIIHSRFNNWGLVDSYKYSRDLKLSLALVRSLFNKSLKKNKLLFIVDENILFFFKDLFKENNHFYTDNIKLALDFLQRTKVSTNISAVIYIGNNNELNKKILTQLTCPVFFFSLSSKGGHDFYNATMLSFHSSVLFLKLILKETIKTSKKINE